MAIIASNMRRGMAIMFNGEPCRVLDFHHHTPGNLRALVQANMAVLALDPVGQGERMQYLDPQTGEQRVRWGTIEHSYAGFQCHVAGFGIARYFIADAMQALTYLAGRPEVDAGRLGVTGNSGGGTQASYLTLTDDRLLCSAPCTYITSGSGPLRRRGR